MIPIRTQRRIDAGYQVENPVPLLDTLSDKDSNPVSDRNAPGSAELRICRHQIQKIAMGRSLSVDGQNATEHRCQ